MSLVEVNKLHSLAAHKDCVYTLAATDCPWVFYSAGADGMVLQWDLKNPMEARVLAKVPSSIYALHFIPEAGLLILGQNQEGLHFIDVKEKKEIATLQLGKVAIFDVKHFGDTLWVGTGDGKVFVIDWTKVKILEIIQASQKSARSLDINAQTGHLAVGYSDDQVRIFDFRSLELLHELKEHENSVFTVKYHPVGNALLTAGRDAHLKIWNIDENYTLKEDIIAHMYAINHIEFAPGGKHFVTCSMDKSIKVWSGWSFKLLKVIDKARHAGHGTSVNKLHWSNYQNQLVSCSDDRSLSVWDLSFDY